MSNIPPTVAETPSVLYCANHPDIETTLRCNRCDKPICTRCAILTPTGYRCRECVRGQQKLFNTAQWFDYPLAIFVAGILSFAGSYIAHFLGFFVIFLAPIAGGIIAEAVRLILQRRRSKRLYQMTAAGAAIGSLPLLFYPLLSALLGGFGSLLPLVFQGLYTIIVTTTVYARFGGIQIR